MGPVRNTVLVLAGILLTIGVFAAYSRLNLPRRLDARTREPDDILVRYDADSRETDFTIALGDCRLVWTAFGTEVNRGVVRHRADCGLPLGEQAPLIGRLLRKLISSDAGAGGLRTLSWGRLFPDNARDATMAARLALTARRSPDWSTARGMPSKGDINAWVKKACNDALIYRELLPVFHESGLEIRLTAVEKVLVLPAGKLPFFEELRKSGVKASDRVPFDCQAWFSVGESAGRAY